MAIKDQCNQCRHQSTPTCPGDVVYDGTSCDNYVKKIDLTKKNEQVEKIDTAPIAGDDTSNRTNCITSEELQKTTNIHGWLSFFLFSIVVGGIISGLYPILMFSRLMAEYGNIYLSLVDLSSGIMLGGLALYTLFAFTKRKPDSVFLGKTYVVTAFLSNLIVLFAGDLETTGFGSLPHVVRSLIWGVIWFLYLSLSEQVNTIIPKSFRKTTSLNYYIIAALILIPSFFMGIGILTMRSAYMETESAFIENVVLSPGEYTDGRFVFKKPLGFKCSQSKVGDPEITLFELENSQNISITMCSDYDYDKNWTNFEDYWENWKDEEADKYESEIVSKRKDSKNDFDYFYKCTCFHLDVDVYWRFILIFDKSSNKVCVVSSYDGGEDSYFDELINSIRF